MLLGWKGKILYQFRHTFLFSLFAQTTSLITHSTGQADRIQVSSDTAELLIAAGKESWLLPREDEVQVKGKGTMKTFWLVGTTGEETLSRGQTSIHEMSKADETTSSDTTNSNQERRSAERSKSAVLLAKEKADERLKRLVKWNCEIMKVNRTTRTDVGFSCLQSTPNNQSVAFPGLFRITSSKLRQIVLLRREVARSQQSLLLGTQKTAVQFLTKFEK